MFYFHPCCCFEAVSALATLTIPNTWTRPRPLLWQCDICILGPPSDIVAKNGYVALSQDWIYTVIGPGSLGANRLWNVDLRCCQVAKKQICWTFARKSYQHQPVALLAYFQTHHSTSCPGHLLTHPRFLHTTLPIFAAFIALSLAYIICCEVLDYGSFLRFITTVLASATPAVFIIYITGKKMLRPSEGKTQLKQCAEWFHIEVNVQYSISQLLFVSVLVVAVVVFKSLL